jgi:hypothetical protein
MKVKLVNYSGNGYNDIGNIQVTSEAVLAIDGSTSDTGVSIISIKDKSLIARMLVSREELSESPVRYKLKLKELVLGIIKNNTNIKHISYEEPCIYHKSAIKNLFMLRTFIEEMIIENEPDLDYINHFEVANTRWKKIFLYPDKMVNDTEKDKQAVNDKVKKIYGLTGDIDLNESDSIGLGYASAEILNGDKDFELESKKKPSKFLYEIRFEDEYDTDLVIGYVIDGEYDLPKKVTEQGMKLKELGNREKLENKIYAEMQDEDCVLIIKLNKLKHGDVVMQYNLSNYENDVIHAIVWRKSRKKLKQY